MVTAVTTVTTVATVIIVNTDTTVTTITTVTSVTSVTTEQTLHQHGWRPKTVVRWRDANVWILPGVVELAMVGSTSKTN